MAAWVRLTGTGTWQTAVGIDGTQFNGFRLVYAPTVNAFSFSMAETDAAPFQAAWATAYAAPAPVVGRWTHLVGVYDAVAHQMRLYVDGQLAGSVSHTRASADVSTTYHLPSPRTPCTNVGLSP